MHSEERRSVSQVETPNTTGQQVKTIYNTPSTSGLMPNFVCFLFHLLRGIVYWHGYDVLNELSTFSKVSPDKCILSTRCFSSHQQLWMLFLARAVSFIFPSRTVASAPFISLCFHIFFLKAHYKKISKEAFSKFQCFFFLVT